MHNQGALQGLQASLTRDQSQYRHPMIIFFFNLVIRDIHDIRRWHVPESRDLPFGSACPWGVTKSPHIHTNLPNARWLLQCCSQVVMSKFQRSAIPGIDQRWRITHLEKLLGVKTYIDWHLYEQLGCPVALLVIGACCEDICFCGTRSTHPDSSENAGAEQDGIVMHCRMFWNLLYPNTDVCVDDANHLRQPLQQVNTRYNHWTTHATLSPWCCTGHVPRSYIACLIGNSQSSNWFAPCWCFQM